MSKPYTPHFGSMLRKPPEAIIKNFFEILGKCSIWQIWIFQDFGVIVVCFYFVLRPQKTMLRAYSWLYTQEVLVDFRRPYGVCKIKFRLTMWKTSMLLTVLSLQLSKSTRLAVLFLKINNTKVLL